MKWPTLFLFSAIAMFGTACEKHHVAELTQLEESHERSTEPDGEVKEERTGIERPDQNVKQAPDAPGPKYFGH